MTGDQVISRAFPGLCKESNPHDPNYGSQSAIVVSTRLAAFLCAPGGSYLRGSRGIMRTWRFIFARLRRYYAPLAVRICAAAAVLCAPGGSYLRGSRGIMRPWRFAFAPPWWYYAHLAVHIYAGVMELCARAGQRLVFSPVHWNSYSVSAS